MKKLFTLIVFVTVTSCADSFAHNRHQEGPRRPVTCTTACVSGTNVCSTTCI